MRITASRHILHWILETKTAYSSARSHSQLDMCRRTNASFVTSILFYVTNIFKPKTRYFPKPNRGVLLHKKLSKPTLEVYFDKRLYPYTEQTLYVSCEHSDLF